MFLKEPFDYMNVAFKKETEINLYIQLEPQLIFSLLILIHQIIFYKLNSLDTSGCESLVDMRYYYYKRFFFLLWIYHFENFHNLKRIAHYCNVDFYAGDDKYIIPENLKKLPESFPDEDDEDLTKSVRLESLYSFWKKMCLQLKLK